MGYENCCYPNFDLLFLCFGKKDKKKYKKEENPKISCYRGKIEQIENLTINVGSKRTNWKSKMKLKKTRKLRAGFEFYL